MSVLWVSNLSQWIGKHVLIKQSSNYSLNWKLEGVDDQRRDELEILMREFKDMISTSEDDLGHTNIVYHNINIGDANPISQPPRSVNYWIIGVVEGPWSSPMPLYLHV